MNGVFVDTDIVMDLLAERYPHYNASAQLFNLADREQLSLYISSLTFANLHFLLSKEFSKPKARQILTKFKMLVKVLSVGDKVIELALASPFKDFEDAIQYYTATEHRINLLLTRNLKDYKPASIPVMSAEEFLYSQQRSQ